MDGTYSQKRAQQLRLYPCRCSFFQILSSALFLFIPKSTDGIAVGH